VYLTGQDGTTLEKLGTARAQNLLEATWKHFKCMQQAKTSSNFSPLLAMHESSQKCKKCNLEVLK
jgi:hypothetical protein